MFDSVYSVSVTASQFLTMAAAAILTGFAYGWLMSFRIRSSRRYFVVISLLPFIVGMVLTFINGSIGAGLAFGGAFALTRFRSAQGTSDEIAGVLIAMSAGVPFGLGYVGYGVLALLGLGVLFLALSSLPIFEHRGMQQDKLLRITIPETLDYARVFDDTFAHYLKKVEPVGVKTTGMGSMFRLSFRIQMKDPGEEKAMIDELRTRNGNLEIAVLPYTEPERIL